MPGFCSAGVPPASPMIANLRKSGVAEPANREIDCPAAHCKANLRLLGFLGSALEDCNFDL